MEEEEAAREEGRTAEAVERALIEAEGKKKKKKEGVLVSSDKREKGKMRRGSSLVLVAAGTLRVVETTGPPIEMTLTEAVVVGTMGTTGATEGIKLKEENRKGRRKEGSA